MAYRINASAEHDEDVRRDAAELAIVANLARAARRRAVATIGVLVLGGWAALLAFDVHRARVPRKRCHHVQIEWENAPSVPGMGWTTCTTR